VYVLLPTALDLPEDTSSKTCVGNPIDVTSDQRVTPTPSDVSTSESDILPSVFAAWTRHSA
jgi:hypothetical protein